MIVEELIISHSFGSEKTSWLVDLVREFSGEGRKCESMSNDM